MKIKEFFIICSIILSGLILYVGICKLMGYPIFNEQKVSVVNAPIRSGHEGEIMPSIELLLSDGKTHFNTGRVQSGVSAVLIYFGPDCPYCQEQMKEIIQKIKYLQGIHFYLVTSYPFDDMIRFYRNYGLSRYSNITVGIDQHFLFASYFKTQSIPYVAVYNSKRLLTGAFIGHVKYEQILEFSDM